MGEIRVNIGMNALTLSLQAKGGHVDDLDLADVVVRAEQELGSADPLTRAINTFAVQMETVTPGDRERMAELGNDLQNAVERATRPDPVGADRRDIYG